MSRYRLSTRSLARLKRVHPSLVAIVKRAIEITEIDFGVTEGMRTKARQRELLAIGATRTLDSYHLEQASGYAHAVDLVAYVRGRVTWEHPAYVPIGNAMKRAAAELGVPLVWGALKQYGGDWRTFNDMPHFQIPRDWPVS